MKRVLIINIAAILLATAVYAQDNLSELRDMTENLQSAAGERSAFDKATYNYGMVFAYGASNQTWNTGVAVFNFSSSSNSFMLGCLDSSGTVVGRGYFTLAGYAQNVSMLSGFITQGYVPARGSIALFGTEIFYADKFIFNTQGGFGEVEKQALHIQ